jgi:putative solute:sodium symporter small subunit
MTHDDPTPSDIAARESAILQRYWRSNLRLMAVLLIIWAAVSLGCGILFADVLNQFELPGTGYPLGFWFAQQGSIIVFVLLILVYAVRMNQLDRSHHKEREALGHLESDDAPFTREGI